MKEYDDIIKDIINHDDYIKMKDYKHHGITRYDHCLRVSLWTYKITKKFKLRYKDATIAGLLHDYFHINNQEKSIIERIKIWFTHPKMAVDLSKKHFEISELSEKIMVSHMFPLGNKIPSSREAWIVCIIDDIASIYERLFLWIKKR